MPHLGTTLVKSIQQCNTDLDKQSELMKCMLMLMSKLDSSPKQVVVLSEPNLGTRNPNVLKQQTTGVEATQSNN